MTTKKTEAFTRIMDGLEDVRAHQRGKLRTLTVRDVELRPPAPMGAREVRAVRAQLHASQAAFARLLNVSAKTVQAWERNTRHPSDAALKLLSVAKRRPEVLFEVDK